VAKPRKAVFMFGNGDMGQLGLGPDTLDEIPRPRIHTWYVLSLHIPREEKLMKGLRRWLRMES
jgi:hypothetical protein